MPLDRLDAVPESGQQCEQVRQAVEDFVRGFARCRFLVRIRTYAYQNQYLRLVG